jgi:predicted flap endonuclease-1-like 5' DNA nuclease
VSDGPVSKRQQYLEEQRRKLEALLGVDPRWQAAIRHHAEVSSGAAVQEFQPPADLADDERAAAYMAVLREIKSLHDDEPPQVERGGPDELRHATKQGDVTSQGHGESGAFRTKINVKGQPTAAPAMQPGSVVAEMPKPSDKPEVTTRDDLTAIRRIDRRLAQRLNEAGIHTYAAIAGWDRYEVRRVRDALDLGKRIWRENWIEQAALLSMRAGAINDSRSPPATQSEITASVPTLVEVGESPAVAAPKATGSAKAADVVATNSAAERPSSAKPLVDQTVVNVQSTEPSAPDLRRPFKVGRRARRLPAPAARRFVYIRGVSEELSDAIRAAGVQSLSDIAKWSRADVRWFSAVLGARAQVTRDQWIEQAALLSRGVWTKHALRVVGGETRMLVERPRPVATISRVVPPGPKKDSAMLAAVPLDMGQKNAVPDEPIESEAGRVATDALVASVAEVLKAPPPVEKARIVPVHSENVAQYDPRRSLSQAISVGKIRRPPPDLEWRWRQPEHQPVSPDNGRPARAAAETGIAKAATPDQQPDKGSAAADKGEPPVFGASQQVEAKTGAREQARQNEPTENDTRSPSLTATLAALGPSETESKPEFDSDSEDREAESLAGSVEFGLVDDWSDAEALVIRKVEPNSPEKQLSPAVLPEAVETVETVETVAGRSPARHAVRTGQPVDPDGSRNASEPIHDDLDGSDALWGGEADVVIVRRPSGERRPSSGAGADKPRPAPTIAAKSSSVAEFKPNSAAAKPASRLSNLMDRRHQLYGDAHDDDQWGGEQVNFGGAAEEATVTIIRAEASTAEASTIAPNGVANDTDAPDQRPEQPKARGLGSRFLKALTGD